MAETEDRRRNSAEKQTTASELNTHDTVDEQLAREEIQQGQAESSEATQSIPPRKKCASNKLASSSPSQSNSLILDDFKGTSQSGKQEISPLSSTVKAENVVTGSHSQINVHHHYYNTAPSNNDSNAIEYPLVRKSLKPAFPIELEIRSFPYCFGRDDVLEELNNTFWKGNSKTDINELRIMFIPGQGGVGKTTVCAHYARKHRQFYPGGVFLVHARTKASLRRSLEKHVSSLCGTADEMKRSLTELNELFLDRISMRGNVLLLYDSSDHLNVLDDILPQWSTRVHVIVTTRCKDHSLMKEGQVISLPPLEQDAAVEAFRCWGGMDEKSMSQIEQQAASDIVRDVRVNTLPLAIRRVAIYMKKTRLTCRMLRTKLEEKVKLRHLPESLEEILKASGLLPIRKILQQEGICQPEDLTKWDLSDLDESCEITQEEQQTLKKVQESLRLDTHGTMHWDLDLEEVSKHSELAMDILNFCSLMESNAIPVEVLCKVTSPNNQDEFRQSLSFLVDDFSLISCDNDEGECSVHALIQESAVKRMTKLASLSSHCTRLSRCLNEMIPQSYHAIIQNVHSKNVVAITPHLYCLCDRILDAQCIEYHDVFHFVQRCCRLAISSHDISTAKRLAERILCATKQSHKVTDLKDMAESLIFMGEVFTLMKQPELAKPYFEEAVDIVRKDGQATTSPQLFHAALNNLALCHRDMNELEEAERLQMELLEIMRRQKASDLSISNELNNLALTYQIAGNLKKAIAMYEESLELKRKSADVSPLHLSAIVMNLGVCYKECGFFNKCVDLLNEAVKIRQSIYIYPHPSLALAVRHLGNVYFLLDDPNTPLHLASELLKKTPTSHRDFAEYMNTVGYSYFARGDYDSARSCFEKSSDWLRSNRPSALPQLATS